jgi:DNA-binding NarL/FixJ family response regulator
LVVDDHQMVGESFRRGLSTDPAISVVGVADSARAGSELAASLQPDVILLDYRLPDTSGTGALRSLRRVSPASRVVLLTGYGGPRLARQALVAGAVAYVEKTQPLEELKQVIHRAVLGGSLVSVAPIEGPAEGAIRDRASAVLSPRELEVLTEFADGSTSRELSERLGISVLTVRKHVQTILGKLDAHSKLEAVAVARRLGLISEH